MNEHQENTRRYYDENAVRWSDRKNHMPDTSFYREELDRFDELAEGSVLEVGVGNGKESAILSQNHEYTGADISEGMIRTAREYQPHLEFVQASVTDLKFEDDSFDNFFTAATLLHIPRVEMPKALSEIRRVVKNNGIGFISLKEGEGEEVRENENGRYFSFFNSDEFRGILEDNGFEVIESGVKPDNREGKPNWLTFFVRVTK